MVTTTSNTTLDDQSSAGITAFHPRPDTQEGARNDRANLFGAIPMEVLRNRRSFITQSRKGIPGHWVKRVVDETGMRDTFVAILGVSSSNLSRVYRRKALGREASEEVLDAVRLLNLAVNTWESRELALEWLNSSVAALGGEKPVDLFDTFEGRRWVAQVLNKIECGDFS